MTRENDEPEVNADQAPTANGKNEETRKELLKMFGFRGSPELYTALRELEPVGSLSTAMYVGVCAWYGLLFCKLCGDRLKGDRPARIVDRWCDDCYKIIRPEDVRNLIEALLPPGSVPARSTREPDPWPDWMYEPVTEQKPEATIFRDRRQNQMEAKAWRARRAELERETSATNSDARPDAVEEGETKEKRSTTRTDAPKTEKAGLGRKKQNGRRTERRAPREKRRREQSVRHAESRRRAKDRHARTTRVRERDPGKGEHGGRGGASTPRGEEEERDELAERHAVTTRTEASKEESTATWRHTWRGLALPLPHISGLNS